MIAIVAVMNITRIGATDKIIASAIVEGKATIDNFTQLSIIPKDAATPPTIDITNNRRGAIAKRLDSASLKKLEIKFSFVFTSTLLEITLSKFFLIVVSIILFIISD